VKDGARSATLDALLIANISAGKTSKIWMAAPEIINWERVGGFRFPRLGRSPEFFDIHLDYFLESVPDKAKLDKDTLAHRRVVCVDQNGDQLYAWQAYKCLYAEIEDLDDIFLLSGGLWYRVTPDFVKQINRAYNDVPDYPNVLPEFNDKEEGDYNKRVAKGAPHRFALMDRKTIAYGGAQSTIEFCDLYTASKDILHLKRYGQSSTLSHLFSQGLVSGELFRMEAAFRERVNSKLPKSHKLADPKRPPKFGEYQVVFGVITDRAAPLVLPFFSRLNFKHATSRLAAYGFRVAKARIPVNTTLAITKKYRKQR
jgi:uncharacterized protein (TIGR04141 family)